MSRGILTGRPWRRMESAASAVIEVLHRSMPLTEPVSQHLLQILAGRGVRSAADLERFFFPSLEQLPDPFLLAEMDVAVERLLSAAAVGEKVAVHGDFDVDGITGCVLLDEFLSNLRVDGRRIDLQPVFVPDRSNDGYGVAARMVRQWAENGVSLLVTVDTGAAAYDELNLARELGMDVVVLDHHLFHERPAAVALVNPRRADSAYPNTDLCGVAVAFKVAQAVYQSRPDTLPPDFLLSILDLVALGLVADQMPLVGENRVLVWKGLTLLRDRQRLRPGLASLLSVAGLDQGFPVTAGDLAYQLAPRLNACGRIGRVEAALELLQTTDPLVAQRLAEEADRTNQERKQADQLLTHSAYRLAEPYIQQGDRGLVLASPDWHRGIIGIGASRLVERFQVPTILVATSGEEARGSGRSIAHIDIKVALDACAHLLIRFGGHAQAAGMTLRTENIPEFRDTFLEALANAPQVGPPPKTYELELPLASRSVGEVTELMHELEHLEPFGMGNRRPIIYCRDLQMARPPQPLGNGSHLRFAFHSTDGSPGGSPALSREFVSFGCGEAWRRWLVRSGLSSQELLQARWEILFQISRSTFRPRSGAYDPVQQLLVDLRCEGES
ncbi:MAG: single-stranded-DNA-specific exonuclease RecJ [bacterium]